MYLSAAVLFLAVALLQGVRGSFVPHGSLNSTGSVIKRQQTSGCTNDRALQQDSQCMEIVDRVNRLLGSLTALNTQSLANVQSSLSNLQSSYSEVFRVFCVPECGNALMNLYEDCGVFDTTPALKDYFIGLCATNKHGDVCYEHYVSSITWIVQGITCSSLNKYSDTCSCKSKLDTAIETIGCCVNVYEDYLIPSSNGFYSSSALYADCNAQAPENCNNSPITIQRGSSSSRHQQERRKVLRELRQRPWSLRHYRSTLLLLGLCGDTDV